MLSIKNLFKGGILSEILIRISMSTQEIFSIGKSVPKIIDE